MSPAVAVGRGRCVASCAFLAAGLIWPREETSRSFTFAQSQVLASPTGFPPLRALPDQARPERVLVFLAATV